MVAAPLAKRAAPVAGGLLAGLVLGWLFGAGGAVAGPVHPRRARGRRRAGGAAVKPAPFAYHRPDTVEEACEALGYYGEDGKILAGGQSLAALLALRITHFENLIDISMVDELRGVEVRDQTIWSRRPPRTPLWAAMPISRARCRC